MSHMVLCSSPLLIHFTKKQLYIYMLDKIVFQYLLLEECINHHECNTKTRRVQLVVSAKLNVSFNEREEKMEGNKNMCHP